VKAHLIRCWQNLGAVCVWQLAYTLPNTHSSPTYSKWRLLVA